MPSICLILVFEDKNFTVEKQFIERYKSIKQLTSLSWERTFRNFDLFTFFKTFNFKKNE